MSIKLCQTICLFAVAFSFALQPPVSSGQTLIPMADRDEHAFDNSRGLLYITTTDGFLERFDVNSQMLLSPFNVGSNLSGIGITSNSSFAYVGERTAGASQGIVRKVNLSTGTRTNLFYNLTSLERGVHDLQITNNGRAVFTTEFAGSGWTPLHQIDLATDVLSGMSGPFGTTVRQNTGIAGAPDGSGLFLQESNISSGPIHSYLSATNSWPGSENTQQFVGSRPAAVSRNGEYVAFDNSFMTIGLALIDLLPAGSGGYVFDPLQDVLYSADTINNELVGLDFNNNFAELGRIAVGENITGNNKMSISADGKLIFMTTAQGVRMFNNPWASSVPEPSTALLLSLMSLSLLIRRRRIE